MDAMLRQQTVFHLTGRRPDASLESIEGLGLRPALLARYRNLARLRYDFPLVLLDAPAEGACARPLTELVNALAAEVAPAGPEGEGLRKQLLATERAIRTAVARGERGRLSAAWTCAVQAVAGDRDAKLAELLAQAGGRLGGDGVLADCDEALPAQLFTHAWRRVQRDKLGRVREDINALIARLDDIVRADFAASEEGRQPESLKAAVGTGQQGLFDFEAMARLLKRGTRGSRIPPQRRQRIGWTLATLRAQRFFPSSTGTVAAPADEAPFRFAFTTCGEVEEAYRQRLPAMAELVKAMSIAELEADGRYDPSRHDAFFEAFDAGSLSAGDLAIFPDYFVCLSGEAGESGLMDLLSSGIPAKVLVETHDLLEEGPAGPGRFKLGVRSAQLASVAVGLNEVYVLQAASAALPRLEARIRRGLATPGAALFAVYTPKAAGLPAYLASAAATQSRAFPVLCYDPAAGEDLATRFVLDDNPQPERDWPIAELAYADEGLQRVVEAVPFTLADFALTEPGHASHFARVPPVAWNGRMVAIDEWLSRPADAEADGVPVVLAVDEANELQRLIVDERLVKAARRCLENWRRLQALAGVHERRRREQERAAWEAERLREGGPPATAKPAGNGLDTSEPVAAVTAAAAEQAPAAERGPDEAWIETVRCSSCNECTLINDRMFAYDENQQAYIKDLSAGTFRELVEAAESCQLSIIHPGKPRNPDEPGLAELIERAKPFL